MKRDEAWAVIDRWSNWNIGQKSTDHAFGGPRTVEDDIYDSRRALLKEAYQTLENTPKLALVQETGEQGAGDTVNVVPSKETRNSGPYKVG